MDISGTAIYRDDIAAEYDNFDFGQVTKHIATLAKKAINQGGVQTETQKEAVGAAVEVGVNRTASVMIYNASGARLEYRSHHDSSGYWSMYGVETSVIQSGEWGMCCHRKASGGATGSVGAVGFNIVDGYAGEVLLIAFEVPWSGASSGYIDIMAKDTYSAMPWDTIHAKANGSATSGTASYGVLKAKWSLSPEDNAILLVKLMRND